MNIKEKLLYIQQTLKAPKSKYSDFGKYNYRTAEKILEAVKPLLKEQNVLLTLNDEVVAVGDRIYVKASAVLEEVDGDGGIQICAYAREQLDRPKYDTSQLTGAASSYARKYALCGLFLIDDEKDPDELPELPEDDSDEELDKQEEAEKPVERRSRKRKKEPEPDFMNIPEGVDEEMDFDELDKHISKVMGGPYDPETGLPTMADDDDETLKEDTYFYIERDDNYVLKHAGDEAPEGGKVITKEEFHEGITRIAQKQEAPKKPRTRRNRRK